MPEVISCPDCERKLRVPDNMLGKKVKCPGCQTIFVAELPGDQEEEEEKPARTRPASQSSALSESIEESPRPRRRSPSPEEEEIEERPRRRAREEEEDEDDRPRRRAREEDEGEDGDQEVTASRGTRGWRRVRDGVNFLVVSTYVQLGAIILVPVVACMIGVVGAGLFANAAAAGNNPAQFRGAAVGAGIGAMLGIGLMVLMMITIIGLAITGFSMFLKAPVRRGVALNRLGLVTLILYSCFLGFYLLNFLANFLLPVVGPVFSIGELLCFLGGFYCQLVLLRSTCQAIGRDGQARTLLTHIFSWAGCHGLGLLMVVAAIALVGTAVFGMTAMGPGPGGGPQFRNLEAIHGAGMVVVAMGCLFLMGFLGLYIWYVVILHQVRDALDSFLRRG